MPDNLQDIIQWDVRSWSKALMHWEQNIDWSTVDNGLELGGREGGMALWLAMKGKKVVCSDLSEVAQTAKPLHERYNVLALVDYQDIDATAIPYEDHFDVIVFKSIIGGIGSNDNIEAQRKAFKSIHRALKPGGKLLYAENMVASPMHRFLRKRFVQWGNRWRYLTVDEMHEFLSDYSSQSFKTTGFLGTFGRSEGQRRFLTLLDELIFNWLTPKSWQYISYGIAVK